MGHSKVLVVGATGLIGKHLAQASARLGHSTFVLVRPSTSAPDSSKKEILDSFHRLGITILHGDLNDHASLISALKHVDVVISAVGGPQVMDQIKLIDAIKEVGHIKRFLPSEYGLDSEKVSTKLEALKYVHPPKIYIRKVVRESGIPYTFVVANAFALFLAAAINPLEVFTSGLAAPSKEKATILGSGKEKFYTVDEDDLGTYISKAVDDPRTRNKVLVVRPKKNTLTFDEVVELWEKKLGHSLDKTYMAAPDVLKLISELPSPQDIFLAVYYNVLMDGDNELGPQDVEATELYPDVNYVTFDKYLDAFL